MSPRCSTQQDSNDVADWAGVKCVMPSVGTYHVPRSRKSATHSSSMM